MSATLTPLQNGRILDVLDDLSNARESVRALRKGLSNDFDGSRLESQVALLSEMCERQIEALAVSLEAWRVSHKHESEG